MDAAGADGACGPPSRHGHYKTVTLVAGLRLRGLAAPRVYDRPMNAVLFEEWVEKCLLPTLSQGDIVVMDNLPAYKGARVEQLIKSAGAELGEPPSNCDFDASRFEPLELAQRRFDGVPAAEREGQRFERDRKARAASVD